MTRNPSVTTNNTKTKNKINTAHSTNSSYPLFTLSMSFLFGMVSLGMILWQRMSGVTAIITKIEVDNLVTATHPTLLTFPYGGAQFPRLTPLILSSALAYQSNNPMLGLLSSWSLWLATPVSAQGALPAIIDFNMPLTAKQGLTVMGGATLDNAGQSVSFAGDVNGDGIGDFLVGAWNAASLGRTGTGTAYLIYGSANLPAILDLGDTNATQAQGIVLQGGYRGDSTGWSVSSAGDVNGDGKSDFLIGAYATSSNGLSMAGEAYLIYGGATLPSVLDLAHLNVSQGVILQGGAMNDNAGYSLSSAGDVNGDGYSDVLIGAWQASHAGRNSSGAAYLIYGGKSLVTLVDLGILTQTQGVVIQGGASRDYAGNSVASAGDVNGDGKDDFLVGAYGTSPGGQSSAGAAYLIYGAADLPTVIDLGNLAAAQGVVLQGGASGDYAGYSVSSAGDVNGDGASDFLVGAYLAAPGGRNQAGATYLIYGSARLPATINLGSLNVSLGVVLQGGAAGGMSGNSVASAGDINGDGKGDFFIGSYFASPEGRTYAGSAYLIYGGVSLPSIINLGNLSSTLGALLQGGVAGDNAGYSLSGGGDVNGDGVSDLIIGAEYASPLGRDKAGTVYVVYGPTSSLTSLISVTRPTIPSSTRTLTTTITTSAAALSTSMFTAMTTAKAAMSQAVTSTTVTQPPTLQSTLFSPPPTSLSPSPSPTTNDVPIIAAAVGGFGFAACLAAGIGLYAYRRRSQPKQLANGALSEPGVGPQNKDFQNAVYSQINLKKDDQSDNAIPLDPIYAKAPVKKTPAYGETSLANELEEPKVNQYDSVMSPL